VPDITEILKRAKPRETTVPIYLAGDVAAELERLERQLADVGGDAWAADSLADTDPREPIARKIEAARKKLKASEVEFRFRALPDKGWSDLLAEHPAKEEGQLFDAATFPRALIAACAVDPAMTPEQVDELYAVLNHAQRNALFDGAFGVNTEGTQIPFSVTASAILAGRTAGK
jgi:hypothetical protein